MKLTEQPGLEGMPRNGLVNLSIISSVVLMCIEID